MVGIETMQIDPSQLFIQTSPERRVDPDGKAIKSAGKQTDRMEFGSAYQKFVDKALENEGNPDSQAVAEARKLLENGDLDSIESSRFAAESLLRFGI